MRLAIDEQEQGSTIKFPKLLMSLLQTVINSKKREDVEISQSDLSDAHKDIATQVLRSLTFTKSDDGKDMLLGVK